MNTFALLDPAYGEPASAPKTGAQPGAGATQPEERSTQFRAVEGGASEMASGGTLLVEAYAAIWLILFGFLFLSWRRQARITSRLAELERAFASKDARNKGAA